MKSFILLAFGALGMFIALEIFADKTKTPNAPDLQASAISKSSALETEQRRIVRAEMEEKIRQLRAARQSVDLAPAPTDKMTIVMSPARVRPGGFYQRTSDQDTVWRNW